ncbi:MAG TPA: hypothetical protein VF258_02155, partial [Luteolibacter sp.]
WRVERTDGHVGQWSVWVKSNCFDRGIAGVRRQPSAGSNSIVNNLGIGAEFPNTPGFTNSPLPFRPSHCRNSGRALRMKLSPLAHQIETNDRKCDSLKTSNMQNYHELASDCHQVIHNSRFGPFWWKFHNSDARMVPATAEMYLRYPM